MTRLLGDVSPLALQVWRRNFEVYLVTWKTATLSLAEPILFLASLGLGIGALQPAVSWAEKPTTYVAFIAPGIVAMSVMFQSFFECLYGSYIRMYYQRTFDAITSTPASLDDVVVGETLWGASRALIGALASLLVILVAGYARTPAALAVPVLAVAGGLLFGAAGICFTACVKNIESINYPLFLVATPLYLFGGVFFPLEGLPEWAQRASLFSPMAHLCTALRRACYGDAGPGVWLVAAGLVAGAVPLLALGIRLMRRRLVR